MSAPCKNCFAASLISVRNSAYSDMTTLSRWFSTWKLLAIYWGAVEALINIIFYLKPRLFWRTLIQEMKEIRERFKVRTFSIDHHNFAINFKFVHRRGS